MDELIEQFDKYMLSAFDDLAAISRHFEEAKESLSEGNIEWSEELFRDAIGDHMCSLEDSVGSLQYRALNLLLEEIDNQLKEKHDKD